MVISRQHIFTSIFIVKPKELRQRERDAGGFSPLRSLRADFDDSLDMLFIES